MVCNVVIMKTLLSNWWQVCNLLWVCSIWHLDVLIQWLPWQALCLLHLFSPSGHKVPVSGLEAGRPGLQGFLTPQRATEPAPSWVMVRSMRPSVNLHRAWSRVQGVPGPWSQAPRLDPGSAIYRQRGLLSLSICKICLFFLVLLWGLNESARVTLLAPCEHLMNARHYRWCDGTHGWVETDAWLRAQF